MTTEDDSAAVVGCAVIFLVGLTGFLLGVGLTALVAWLVS
jgi:hypothetical protein